MEWRRDISLSERHVQNTELGVGSCAAVGAALAAGLAFAVSLKPSRASWCTGMAAGFACLAAGARRFLRRRKTSVLKIYRAEALLKE